MINRLPAFLALIGVCAVVSLPARAQRVDSLPDADARIAAVVNDNIISTVDLEARIRLAMLSSGLPETAEIAHRLLPQVLRSLIDEQLQLQEAKRLDITVTKEEIDQTMDRIAQDNHIPGDMKAYIVSHGVPLESLVSQIRGALAWNKVIQRELRPRVDIGDDEVDSAIERIRANAGKEEYLVSEIFLSVDNPKDEDQVRQFADNLAQQLKSGGNFGAVARQFSQGTGAASGGDIGWIQAGQLSAELSRALIPMQAGDTAGPIRTANGFHILGLREKRTIAATNPGSVTLALQQAFQYFRPGANKGAIIKEAGLIHTTINGCTNLKSQLAEKFSAWRLQNIGDIEISRLPSWVAAKVRDLPAGKASEPVPTTKGALVFFVCGRHVPEGGIDRNTIISNIGTEKLELQARRLLRDLRREAYIDVRLAHTS